MRTISTLAALLLATGCAAQPRPPAAPVAVAPAAAAPATTVQEAMKAGYKMVNRDGETVYCRKQLKTGSHVRHETICLTAEELEAAREASRRNLSQMQRREYPRQGK